MLGLSPRITGLYGADCALSLAPAAASEPGGGSELPWRPTLLAGSGYVTRTKRPHVYVYELPPRLTTWVNVRRLDRPTHNLFTQVCLSVWVCRSGCTRCTRCACACARCGVCMCMYVPASPLALSLCSYWVHAEHNCMHGMPCTEQRRSDLV